MDPPTYTTAAVPARTIEGLRAQVIANASILKREWNRTLTQGEDFMEVIVAKVPTSTAPPLEISRSSEKRPLTQTSSSQASSAQTPFVSDSEHAGKHYAIVVRRTMGHGKLQVLMRGEPQPTVEGALEWVLGKSEELIHDEVVKYGKMEKDGCSVM